MLPMVIIVGSDVGEKTVFLKKLTAELARRGLSVGVVLHRLRGTGGGDGDEVKEFSAAGARQVMVTTGREPVFYPPTQKTAGLPAVECGQGIRHSSAGWNEGGYASAGFAKKFRDGVGLPRVLHNKQGGITPLQRVAARYFSSVDILLADGYHDPLPKIEVCLSDREGSLRFADDPNLKAVVCETVKPESAVPVFTLEETDKLADFILAI